MKSLAARPAPDAGLFLLEAFMPYELSVAANRASRLFARRYSGPFGLTIAEWRVLAVLGRFGALSPGQVAERTEMDKVKVSRAVAGLAAAGRLSQDKDPRDGRGRVLRLTPAGIDVHRAIVPMARALEAQLAAGLSPAEWAALRAGLRKLDAHVRRLAGADAPARPASLPDL